MKGKFLYNFFAQRDGDIKSPTYKGEIQVRCPFPHNKGGLEERPSAFINVEMGVFKCFTCQAEGRFNNGGMSELNFVRELYSISYEEALKFIRSLSYETKKEWEAATKNLLGSEKLMDFLSNRGITKELIYKYGLGYTGEGIAYPVFVHNICVDVRTYNPFHAEDEPKIKSRSGATAMLYPFDHWKETESEYTIFNAGENDTLLMRKYGFNAVTPTLGEGSVPKMLLQFFTGKKVIVLYDCDPAGESASLRIAYYLKEAGAEVFIADLKHLGMTGDKDDKDITDYFIKREGTAKDLQESVLDRAIPFTDEMMKETKNRLYPLVELWDVYKGEYKGKRLSSRVMMIGKPEMIPLEIPTIIQGQCERPNLDDDHKSPCWECPLHHREEVVWDLDETQLQHVIHLSDNNEDRMNSYIKSRIFVIPKGCPRSFFTLFRTLSQKNVQRVYLSPDVESESELLGYKDAIAFAYVIENDDGEVMANSGRYRIYFKRYSHFNDSTMNLVVDRFENSDNSLNTFEVNDDIVEQLTQFQGHPNEVMKARVDNIKNLIGNQAHEMVILATDLVYHSVLDFKYGKEIIKGHPEGIIIGAPNTAKSSVAKFQQKYYGMGNFKGVKGDTFAGLVGGAEQQNGKKWNIKWGTIPRNDGGMLILDEMSGLNREVIKQMTFVRSERVAQITKIAEGRAQARTRLLWISNPAVLKNGKSRNMTDYNNGVDITRDLVGSNEDIRRFDFIITLPSMGYVSQFGENGEDLEAYSGGISDPHRNLIRWAWTRKAQNIKFDHKIALYIENEAILMNQEFYDGSDLHILGNVGAQKLARLSVSVAVMCFSHDGTGENVLVKREHVDWAVRFLRKCYDNEVFRLVEYVAREKQANYTNDEVNVEFARLASSNETVYDYLDNQSFTVSRNLQMVAGLSQEDFGKIIAQLLKLHCIKISGDNIYITGRFKKASAIYKKLYKRKDPSGMTEKVFKEE